MENHYVFLKDVGMTSESLVFLWKTWQRHWEDVVFSWKMLHLIEKYKYVQFLLRNQRLSEKHNVFPTHFQRLSEKHNVFATHFKRLSEKHHVFSRNYVSNSLIGQYLTRDFCWPDFLTPSQTFLCDWRKVFSNFYVRLEKSLSNFYVRLGKSFSNFYCWRNLFRK